MEIVTTGLLIVISFAACAVIFWIRGKSRG